jgi:hypothetical protein
MIWAIDWANYLRNPTTRLEHYQHAHARIKRYNAVSSVDRNRVADFEDYLMLNAADLWNFYLEAE